MKYSITLVIPLIALFPAAQNMKAATQQILTRYGAKGTAEMNIEQDITIEVDRELDVNEVAGLRSAIEGTMSGLAVEITPPGKPIDPPENAPTEEKTEPAPEKPLPRNQRIAEMVESHSRDELVSNAEEAGVTVGSHATKEEIATAIVDAEKA